MKRAVYLVLLIVCLCVFGFSAYKLYDIYSTRQSVKNEIASMEKHVATSSDEGSVIDWAALQKEDPDVIAWIYIPDTPISFPVMQGDNNEYYLNHSFTGEPNYMGSIFLDAAASPDFTDDNSLIYGHTVDTGGMFTDIKDFADRSYFDSHPFFYLLTPNGNYRCPIISFADTTDASSIYTTGFGDQREEVLANMKKDSTWWRDVDPDYRPLITLSTCNIAYGFHSPQRYTLTGILEPTADRIDMEAAK